MEAKMSMKKMKKKRFSDIIVEALSQKACLVLCKLPTDQSVQWNELEPADVLRAVRRFHLQFPWASWEQAEDYIFEKFGKVKSEGTRGGKIRENRNADAKGLPAPHRIRKWNTKNSKAASAPAADALNNSAAPDNVGTTTTVDQDDYLPTAAPAPTADDNLFFGSEMDLDDDDDDVFVKDDHEVHIQAAIEDMQADSGVFITKKGEDRQKLRNEEDSKQNIMLFDSASEFAEIYYQLFNGKRLSGCICE
ncbi:Protein of unknown function [Pyronema omphalodes CBS 100304]|uniref:Uncharacterized protein n=1 Tax=Pyronema omphalodes (strain CBS 100304) TaxID=1076935 RepID=U4LJF6_PYROM|nr:Protein of unknown function [Pyronema omphalodes CBS 100304]